MELRTGLPLFFRIRLQRFFRFTLRTVYLTHKFVVEDIELSARSQYRISHLAGSSTTLNKSQGAETVRGLRQGLVFGDNFVSFVT
jgi:hypothetical protein